MTSDDRALDLRHKDIGSDTGQPVIQARTAVESRDELAHATAKSVIASANRLIDVRQSSKSSRIAELACRVADADPQRSDDVERPADRNGERVWPSHVTPYATIWR